MKKIFKTAIIAVMCTLIFLGAAVAYLGYDFKKSTAVEQKSTEVPYRQTPQNKGILIAFPSGSGLLAFLDFDTMGIDLLNIEKIDSSKKDYDGYSVDYNISIDYQTIEGIVDRVGGINLTVNKDTHRYTGVQVTRLISDGCSSSLRRQIITQIFKQISKNSFSKEDFAFVLTNAKTDLSIIDCIEWGQYIDDMCGKIQFISD